jgi:hypothetical protein
MTPEELRAQRALASASRADARREKAQLTYAPITAPQFCLLHVCLFCS